MPAKLMMTALLVLACTLTGCATSGTVKKKPMIEKTLSPMCKEARIALLQPEKALSAACFEEKVRGAGGRVEFAFGDDAGFVTSHASTLVETGDGKIVVAWFGGTEEGNPDVAIWYAVFDGKSWSPPQSIAKVEETAHWNPVLFKDENNVIHLFFKVGKDEARWTTWWMSSTDNAVTWSDASVLVSGDIGGRGPVKNKAVILADGRWCAPASTETELWESFVDFSSDGGQSWQRSENFPLDRQMFPGEGTIQPTVWESEPGHIHALLRSTCGAMLRSDSTDNGATWSDIYDSGLPNNNSGADLVKLEDGRLLLVLNPVAENWGGRTPLSLALSKDNGQSWSILAHLEDAPAETGLRFSYPAIVHSNQGVAVSYTYNTAERIRFWFIPLEALE